jgi:succinate dehydrogenase hydrophobic anchor subunit
MLNERIGPRKGESTALWMVKILSGVFVLTLLFIHLVANHLLPEQGLMSFREVVVYLSNPWIALMEGTFLVIVTVHALVGTRSVVLDLNPSPSLLKRIDFFFILLGVVAIIYGIWLLTAIRAFAQ